MPTLPNISPELIKAYQEEIEKSSSDSTAKRKLVSLNKFLDWATNKGHIETNPLAKAQNSLAKPDPAPQNRFHIPTRTFGIIGMTTGLVILLFALIYKLGSPIEYITNFAQEATLQTLPNRNLPTQTTTDQQASIPVVIAGNGAWNIFAKLKLMDTSEKAIVGSETISFKIFDKETNGTPVYTSEPQTVTTDANGSTLISLDNVPTDLFFKNNQLYLEPQIGSDSASVRIPISTANTPVIGGDGNIVLTNESPSIKAKQGNFLIEGQAVTLKTADGSDGNIEINPDGKGYVHFLFEGNKGNMLNVQGPNLTSGSLYYGMVPNNATGYDLIRLQSGSKLKTKFSVDAVGNTFTAGDLNVARDIQTAGVDRLTSTGELKNITGYTQNSGNFTISQNAGDTASVIKKGSALSDVMTLTLNEPGSPAITNTNYSTLVLNRYNGNNEGAALKVNTGNAIFNGQIQIGRYETLPEAIGKGSLVYNSTDNKTYVWNGTAWTAIGGGGSGPFTDITSGTNTTAAMIVGSGASLSTTGTGTISATDLTCVGCVANSELANSAITINTSGILSGGATVSLGGTINLTATEADTLDSVTGRGATTVNGITIGNLTLNDTKVINIGGNGSTVAYNAIADSVAGANASMTSDKDLYVQGNMQVGGSINGLTINPGGLSTGSVVFINPSGVLAEDNTNFFWDNTNKRIGIGDNTPLATLTVGAGDLFQVDGSTGSITTSGDISVNGNSTLGDTSADNITFNGRVAANSSLVPIGTTGTNDLGSSALPWDNVYGVILHQNGNLVCDVLGNNCPFSGGYWDSALGALYPTNSTLDVLFGGNATTSAKFAFTGVSAGTPTASISGTYLTSTGTLSNTNMRDITLGGVTTGNVISSSPFVANSTITLPNSNTLTGISNYLQLSNGVSVGNGTTYYFDKTGNINATGITGTSITDSGLSNNKVVFTDGAKTLTSTGTVGPDQGGTGFSTYAIGDLLYADTTSTLAKLADIATGNVLISGGVGTAPSWNKVVLGTHTSGNYVSSLAGTVNQITASGSTGDITLSIPSDFRAPGTVNAVNGIYTGATAGTQRIDASGNLVNIGTTQLHGLTYTWPASIPSSNYVLQTQTNGTLAWVDPSAAVSSNVYWTSADGAIFPKNNTMDVLIGSNATTSAKFAFINVNSGTPTASISGTTANVSTFVDGNGNISSTNRNNLTLGNSATYDETGNILLNPNGTGNVGIGTTSPTAMLDVAGSASVSGTLSFRTGTGTIAATNMDHLVLGGTTTGQVDVNNDLNLASAKSYLINGISVLNATTLGTNVVTSSLTTVGALASGSIASGFGTIATANTITGTTINGTTGVNTGATAGTQRIDSTGNLINITNITASGTINFGTLTGSKVVFTDSSKNLTSTGTVEAIQGGTGQSVYAIGDMLYANSTTTLAKLADVAVGNVLISGGVNTAPSWDKVVLGTHTSGNYVATITGTANQITSSGSTGDITLSVPSDFRAPGTVNAVNGIYTGATAGTQRIDASGNLTNIGTTQLNGVTYTWPAAAIANYVLQAQGTGATSTLAWVDPAAAIASNIYWTQNGATGVLYPKSNSVDVLIGSDATISAKFAFTGVNSGTPTASISGTTANVATYLTGDGTLSTTNAHDLTLGSLTTGNIILKSRNVTSLTADGANLTAAGNLAINGGNLTSTAGTFNLLNGNSAQTINFGSGTAGNTITIGNNNVSTTLALTGGTAWNVATNGNIVTSGDVAVNGGDLTSTGTTFNLLNATVTTLNMGGAVTALNLGDAATTKTIDIGGVVNSGTDTINIATNATAGDTISIGNNNAATSLSLTGGTNWSIAGATGDVTTAGDVYINGGDLITTSTTFNLLAGATTLNIGPTGNGVSSVLISGGSADTGCTIDGATGALTCSGSISSTMASGIQGWWQLNGSDLAPASTSYNLAVGGTTSASPFYVVASTGNITTSGDLAVNGGDLTSTSTAFNFDIGNTGTLSFRDGTNTMVKFFDQEATGSAAVSNALQVGSLTMSNIVSPYSRFGTADTGHGLSSPQDVLIGGNLELNGILYLDGRTIANSSGTATIIFSSNAAEVDNPNILDDGVWWVNNTVNNGMAALMVNQSKGGDIFSASASGVAKFTIANTGNISATGTLTGLTGLTSSGTINFSGLTASRALFTDASSNLAVTGTSAMLLNALSDETGTGVSVFGTSPTFTTSIIDPLVVGGTAANSTLTLEGNNTTSNTATNANLVFKVGDSAGTTAMTILNNGNIGIGTTAPAATLSIGDVGNSAWKLYIKGQGTAGTTDSIVTADSGGTLNFYVTDAGGGYLRAAAWAYGSDRRLKQNIDYSYINDGLGKINQLKPVSFQYLNSDIDQLGFVAQDVQNVIPEAVVVADEATGMLGLKTDFIIPYLVRAIQEQQTQIASVSDQLTNFIATNIKAGYLKVEQIVAPKVQVALISPLPNQTDVTVQIGSEATPSGKFAIQNIAGDEVASIDNQGNATFSGEVHAQNIDQIQNLLNQVVADQSVLFAATSSANLNTSNSVEIDQFIASDLYITNHAAINSLMINDTLTAENINSLSGPLQIQSLAMAPVEIMAGLITIDTHGNVNIAGNLNVAGTITAPTANLNDLTVQNLTIAANSESTPSAQINSGEIQTNATAGKAVIPTGTSEIIINNPKVTDYTLVYVTPTSSTQNNVLYVKSKQVGQFVVGFTNPVDVDAQFNWWIIEIK